MLFRSSVIVATTPGGFASLVGNAYFFTWLTTVFVMETSLWFIHDFRGSVHKALDEKNLEYKLQQEKVLQQSKQMIAAARANSVYSGTMPMPPPFPPAARHPPPPVTLTRSSSPAALMAMQQQQQQQQHSHQVPHHHHRQYHSNTFDDVDEDFGNTPAVVKRLRFGSNPDDEYDNDRNVMDDINSNNNHDNNTDSDDSLKRELQFKERNKVEYFDTLDDILE